MSNQFFHNVFLLYDQYFANIFRPELNRIDDGYQQFSGLNLPQGIMLSWPFMLVEGVISFLMTSFFVWLFLHFNQDYLGMWAVGGQSVSSSLYIFYANIVLGIIFFPLGVLFSFIYWKFAFRIILWWLKVKDDAMSEELYTASLSSYVFVILPVFGGIVQKIAFFFILFKGLRARLELGPFSCFLILFFPYMLFIMVLLVCVGFITMLLSTAG